MFERARLYFSIAKGYAAVRLANGTRAKVIRAAELAVLLAKLTPDGTDDGIAAKALAITQDEAMLNAVVILVDRGAELQAGLPIESEAEFLEVHGDEMAALDAAGLSPMLVLMIVNIILQIMRDRRAQ